MLLISVQPLNVKGEPGVLLHVVQLSQFSEHFIYPIVGAPVDVVYVMVVPLIICVAGLK